MTFFEQFRNNIDTISRTFNKVIKNKDKLVGVIVVAIVSQNQQINENDDRLFARVSQKWKLN